MRKMCLKKLNTWCDNGTSGKRKFKKKINSPTYQLGLFSVEKVEYKVTMVLQVKRNKVRDLPTLISSC